MKAAYRVQLTLYIRLSTMLNISARICQAVIKIRGDS